MKRLIVNADDFGLTAGVSRTVAELARLRAVSSATLMANGKAFNETVRLARETRALGVGCHIVLVDGTPVLPPERLPHLVPSGGAFRQSLASFTIDLLTGRIPESEIEAEAASQIRRLQAAGIRVTHLDTHKHTHVWPRVLRPLLLAARCCGVGAIRNPFEPEWSLRATHGGNLMRRAEIALLRTQQGAFTRLVEQAGLATTKGAAGVLATGTLDGATIEGLLRGMPEGDWELVCHPGTDDADLRAHNTRLLHSRVVEADGLRQAMPLAASLGIETIHFGSLGTSR